MSNEKQIAVAWQSRFIDGGQWGFCTQKHHELVQASPADWPGYETRALVPAAPAPVAQGEFEVRADGERVRVDRWEVAIRRIVALLWGNQHEFEVDDVVEAVRGLIPTPRDDDESLVISVLGGSYVNAEPAAPAPVAQEPVAWRDHVEQRMRQWRQRAMNRSGDRLALDDFMDANSLEDLIDYVCDEWAAPAPVALTPAQSHADELLSVVNDFSSELGPCRMTDAARAVIAKIEATGQEGPKA